MPPSPRILVIRGGAIGDFILTLPAIRLLREQLPQAHLEILGYKPIIELAAAAGIADSIRSLDHAAMSRLFIPKAELDAGLGEYFRSFNLVVSYLFDPDGIVRGNMDALGVKTFIEASHQVVPGQGHAAEQLAKPLERLALFLEDPAARLQLAPRETAAGRPVVAIHPGSGSMAKNWPAENWSRLGTELAALFPAGTLALVTGEAEAERGITRTVVEAWRGRGWMHWDQLPLVELAERLAGCAAFLGHDSGVSHLAAACGLPCLLFFGPTDPGTWAPRNPGVRIFLEPTGSLRNLRYEDGREAVRAFLEQTAQKVVARPL